MMEMPITATDSAMIIWNADKSELPSEELSVYTKQLLNIVLDPARIKYVEKPLLYWEEETMRLGYYIIAE